MPLLDQKRGTGRTTRMLQEAIRTAELSSCSGVMVMMLGSDIARTVELIAARRPTWPCHRSGHVGNITVCTLHSRYDFRTQTVPGHTHRFAYFVDHAVLEHSFLFQSFIEHWCRFDAKVPPLLQNGPSYDPDRPYPPIG